MLLVPAPQMVRLGDQVGQFTCLLGTEIGTTESVSSV